MSLIEFQDVVRTYGEGAGLFKATDHISFSIEEGEFVVILGPSGAGKSTVLNMLGGMDKPTSGRVIINGTNISELSSKKLCSFRAENIGFIFQFYNLLSGLTVYENVALTKDIKKNSISAEDMLKEVGIWEQKDRFPSQLSGGQQQRVSIARALSKDPMIILGDEPTGALDSVTGVEVLKLLFKMRKERHKTVILVTHNSGIGECADRVIHMKNGKISSVMLNKSPKRVEEVVW